MGAPVASAVMTCLTLLAGWHEHQHGQHAGHLAPRGAGTRGAAGLLGAACQAPAGQGLCLKSPNLGRGQGRSKKRFVAWRSSRRALCSAAKDTPDLVDQPGAPAVK